ncbi:group II intron reverse transcriptase/maturase [Limosilactobacillus oris]|uniref:group II intron reverse transcriptase/maturase n=1 Tax=Limosilactobacillus oris TaxID=1632 RepID=UPI0024B36ADC|nr:group II intron reverse transcriptase/maturase [Limosilactobacillus oris]WHO86080.1 group II intron reverse transcriptase/maturase [Limosilactobacillus oris]
MRQSQKTEPQADRLSRIGLENRKYTRVRSTDYGKGKGMSVTIQDLVLDRNNLNQAYLRVKRNKGAAGIDGMTVFDLLQYLRENKVELITSLRDGSYKPSPVKRVEIPKPNGGVRKLGIPTVVDRMVQQAVAQVLMPIFEQIFSDNSFGFRPHRGAQDAIARVVDLYNQGYRRVVDLDLKAYFDNVNHDLMIKYLQQYIDDSWTLKLIRKFLTSGVLDHGLFAKSDKGTPQGGPLSPLLANIYLNELDKELTRRGHHFVRYADDCNIYVKSQRAGERVMRSITKFLGFSLGVDRNAAYARPAKQSQQRVKKTLKLLTKRNRGVSLTRMFEEIQQKMRGWLQYYSIGKLTGFIQRLDQWLRARIRQYIWKQWKKLKTKVTNLQRLGLSYRDAYVFASTRKGYWRTAHSKTLSYSLTNRKLEHLGLINLSKTLQSIQK